MTRKFILKQRNFIHKLYSVTVKRTLRIIVKNRLRRALLYK